MRSRVWSAVLAGVLATTVLPSTAAADIVIAPLGGINFGGDASDKPFTFGGGVTFVGRSIGLEVEATRTNDFFGSDSADVTLLTAALVGSADLPGTGIKPYFLSGAGLLRTNAAFSQILDDTSYNNFAIMIGGGLNAYFTDNLGLRADIRYYRRLESKSDVGILPIASNFDFWRASLAFNIRFF